MPIEEAIAIARVVEAQAVRESGWARGRDIKKAMDILIETANNKVMSVHKDHI